MPHPNLERLLAIICSVLDAHSAVLFLPENPKEQRQEATETRDQRLLRGAVSYSGPQIADAAEYRIAASFSLSDNLNRNCAIRPGQGQVGWILKNKEPLLVPHFDRRKGSLGYYNESVEDNIKAFMGCPLPGNWGALCVDCKRQYSFSEKDQKLLHLFADLVSTLIAEGRDSARLKTTERYYKALKAIYVLRREHSRWKIFLRHLLGLVAVATGYEYCAMCSCGQNDDFYELEEENMPVYARPDNNRFPNSNGAAGWVFRNGAPVFTEGTEGAARLPLIGTVHNGQPFQRVIVFPLIIQRKTRGVLCLGSVTTARFDDELKDFVRMVSEHLALFLENLFVKSHLFELNRQVNGQAGA